MLLLERMLDDAVDSFWEKLQQLEARTVVNLSDSEAE